MEWSRYDGDAGYSRDPAQVAGDPCESNWFTGAGICRHKGRNSQLRVFAVTVNYHKRAAADTLQKCLALNLYNS